MATASWKCEVLAESDACVNVEGNSYFPPDAVHWRYLKKSDTTTICPRKGTAHYYDVVVHDDVNKDAAWYYPDPKDAAKDIKDHIAFWRGIDIA